MSNKKERKKRRVGGGLVLGAKGQLSGADDSVCVCARNVCLAARVYVSILIYFCLTAWHMCLLCECVASVLVRLCLCGR